MNRNAKRTLLLGIVVSGSCLVIAFNGVDIRQSWQTVRSVDVSYLGITILATVFGLFFRVWRWLLLFPVCFRPTFRRCFSALSVGLMANNFLPLHGGEILRCALIQNNVSLRGTGGAIASVGIERIMDGIVLVGMLFVSIIVIQPPEWVVHLCIVSACIFGLAVLLLVLFFFRFDQGVAVLKRGLLKFNLESLSDKVESFLAPVPQFIKTGASIGQLFLVVGLSVALRICEAIMIWGMALSLGIELGLGAAVLVQTILGLGLTVPSAPGYIGTYEFFTVSALKLYGIHSDPAMALCLVMHSWLIISMAVFGLLGVALGGFSWKSVLGDCGCAEEVGRN